jgi:hypothetical protein
MTSQRTEFKVSIALRDSAKKMKNIIAKSTSREQQNNTNFSATALQLPSASLPLPENATLSDTYATQATSRRSFKKRIVHESNMASGQMDVKPRAKTGKLKQVSRIPQSAPQAYDKRRITNNDLQGSSDERFLDNNTISKSSLILNMPAAGRIIQNDQLLQDSHSGINEQLQSDPGPYQQLGITSMSQYALNSDVSESLQVQKQRGKQRTRKQHHHEYESNQFLRDIETTLGPLQTDDVVEHQLTALQDKESPLSDLSDDKNVKKKN